MADFAKPKGKGRFTSLAFTSLTWLLAGIFFFPIFWMFISGFKSELDANGAPKLFFEPTLEQYRIVTETPPGQLGFWEATTNSFIIVIVSTLIVMMLAVPTAYALTIRPVGKWMEYLFFFISTKFLPIVASILPIYILAKHFDLLSSRRLLIILYMSMNLPLAIWMLRSFFQEVPRELIEAAEIDGANLRSQMVSVILPIVAPGLAATALLCFIFAWNEYFLAVQLNTTGGETVPIWASSVVDERGQFLAKLSAASTLATLPVIVAGWVAQKRMIRGLAMGAIK